MVLSYLFVTIEEHYGNGQTDISAAYSYIPICNGIKYVFQFEHVFDLYLGFLNPKMV
jgi:hypothetical protein